MALAAVSSSSAASSSTLSDRTLFSHSPSKLPLQRKYVSLALPSPFCRLQLVSTSLTAWQHRPLFIHRVSQTEAKVLNEDQDTEASDSEYESSDEEDDGSTTGEASLTSVVSMLNKYKEALSNNDEAAVKEFDAKFQQFEVEKATYAKQLLTLNEEVQSLKERFLRLNADFDNFRKRAERDRINVSFNVKGDVMSSLLPMVDNFERAKTQIKIETEGEQRIDNSYQGIYKHFVEIMKGLGVSAIETVGKKFDPNVHEAIMRGESSQYPEEVIIEEFRRGFMLGDKLLRPSMVKVSAGAPAITMPDSVVTASLDAVADDGSSESEDEATK